MQNSKIVFFYSLKSFVLNNIFPYFLVFTALFCVCCLVLQTNGNVQSDPALHEHHAHRSLQPRVSHENFLFRREGKQREKQQQKII